MVYKDVEPLTLVEETEIDIEIKNRAALAVKSLFKNECFVP